MTAHLQVFGSKRFHFTIELKISLSVRFGPDLLISFGSTVQNWNCDNPRPGVCYCLLFQCSVSGCSIVNFCSIVSFVTCFCGLWSTITCVFRRETTLWPYWRPRQWLWRFRWLLMRSNKANNGNLEHFVKTTLKSVICLYSHQFLGKNLILKFRETAYFYLGYSADLLLTSTDHAFTLSSSLSSDCARCSPRGARRCCPLIKMLNQAWIFFIIRDLQGIALVASLS